MGTGLRFIKHWYWLLKKTNDDRKPRFRDIMSFLTER